jgi:homoprotocatechuate degradation regulator HpaR
MSIPSVTQKSLSIALLRAREHVMAHFRPHLAELGLTEQQWRVLRVLGEADEIDAGELAIRASILPASLSRILKSLLEDKFVATRHHKDDGRRTLVSLATKGQRLLERALPQTAAIYRKLEKQIGTEELMHLQRLLEHVQQQLGDTTE